MKKPTRKETQTKQRQLVSLRNLAKLRQFLPKEEGIRLIVTSSGGIQVLPSVSELDPHMAASRIGSEGRLLAGLVSKERGVGAIHRAAVEYKEEYDRAAREALAGIAAGDLAPLCRHLALLGFDLFEDFEILANVQSNGGWRLRKGRKKAYKA